MLLLYWILDRIVASNGVMSIAALARGAGLSARQLDRVFAKNAGMSPKRYCRIVRFRTAWELGFRARRKDWSMIAIRCGYADQVVLSSLLP